jgi:hypothetical protein
MENSPSIASYTQHFQLSQSVYQLALKHPGPVGSWLSMDNEQEKQWRYPTFAVCDL